MEKLGGERGQPRRGVRRAKWCCLVNVASKCGYTRQYEGLQQLHADYVADGLAVVGVPCNQFGGQEPGTADEIRSSATRTTASSSTCSRRST